jgi:urease accessory protein
MAGTAERAVTASDLAPERDVPPESLVRLLAFLSPIFPIGAYAYSHGLEQAIHDGRVSGRDSLRDWLADLLTHGSLRSEAVLFAAAWRAASRLDIKDLMEVQALAAALAPSRERRAETMDQGAAFLKAASHWPSPALERLAAATDGEAAYPVAAAAALADAGVPLRLAVTAYLQALTSNLVLAAVRLMPLGQTGALATLRALEPLIVEAAARAATSTLDDLGSATILSDIASLRHETLEARLFRS